MPPVNLFIRSFKDGVGRQAPSKRLPTEAQALVNTVVTVERSAEKRPGTTVISCTDSDRSTLTLHGDLELPISSDDMFHHWFDLTPSSSFLVSVDFKGTGDLLHLHEVTHNGGVPEIRKVTTVAGTALQRAYVRESNSTKEAGDVLEISSLGPSLLILNKTVATGYTSRSTGKTINLDGTDTTTDDSIGAEVNYESASATDPEGTALIWVENRAYVGGQEVYKPSAGVGGPIYRVKEDISSGDNTDAAYGDDKWEDTNRNMARVSVKNFDYPDSSKAYLGQSLTDISEINLPPKADDVLAHNGAEAMLAVLYTDDLGDGQNGRAVGDGGKGKIYYMENGYGGTEPGYYIVRSATAQPYLKKIRTPEAYSVIDAARMPLVLIPSNGGDSWSLENGSYNERISGDDELNPGPTAWAEGKQFPISTMAIFRDRLWFAIGDTIFSSRTNDNGNFFLKDPSLIVDTDPIDVRLSSNKYTPVVSLTPFESTIFVNTGADVQFQLEGSDNQITPYTAALSSESFYSTSAATTPVLMGNQVYFFDDQRLYIYMPSASSTVQRAQEVSKSVPNYLPNSYGAITVNNAYETVFMTDNEDRTKVYCYTNRFSGNQLLQNAFFQMEYSTDIVSLSSHEEEIYFLTRDSDGRVSFSFQKFREDDPATVYLDDVISVVADTPLVRLSGQTTVYDSATNQTLVTFESTTDTDNDTVVLDYNDPGGEGGSILTISSIDRSIPGSTVVSVRGRITAGSKLLFGKNFEMRIDLSPIFQRDQQNNVVDGLLSLRSMHTRHSNTGAYRIEKSVRGRSSTPTRFTPMELDLTAGIDPLALEATEVTGEAIAKVFGNSDETRLSVVSDTPNPVNITQIQLKGIFNEKYSSFNR